MATAQSVTDSTAHIREGSSGDRMPTFHREPASASGEPLTITSPPAFRQKSRTPRARRTPAAREAAHPFTTPSVSRRPSDARTLNAPSDATRKASPISSTSRSSSLNALSSTSPRLTSETSLSSRYALKRLSASAIRANAAAAASAEPPASAERPAPAPAPVPASAPLMSMDIGMPITVSTNLTTCRWPTGPTVHSRPTCTSHRRRCRSSPTATRAPPAPGSARPAG